MFSSPHSAAFRTSRVSAVSFSLEVISLYISSRFIVRSGVSVALFTVLPVVLSFIGEIGGMNSDILKTFSITFYFFNYFILNSLVSVCVGQKKKMSLLDKAASSHLQGLIFAKAGAKLSLFTTCCSTLIHTCFLLLFSLSISRICVLRLFK